MRKAEKIFREIFKSESPNDISQWEQVKGLETTPNRSASLRCILTTEYTGAKDFISDDSPKVGTPRPRHSQGSRKVARLFGKRRSSGISELFVFTRKRAI